MALNPNTEASAGLAPAQGEPNPAPKYDATPLIDIQLSGVVKSISRVFQIKEPEMVLTNDWIHYFAQRFNHQDQNIQYPIVYFMPRTFSRFDGGYPAAKLSKSQYSVLYGLINEVFVENRVIPTTLEVEIFYVTNSAKDFIRFANDWVIHSVSGALNFSVDYLGTALDIQMKTAESITIPEKDMTGEAINQTIASGTATVQGYTNQIKVLKRDVPTFKNVQVSFNVTNNANTVELESGVYPTVI